MKYAPKEYGANFERRGCTGYENILNAMERIVEETYKVVGE